MGVDIPGLPGNPPFFVWSSMHLPRSGRRVLQRALPPVPRDCGTVHRPHSAADPHALDWDEHKCDQGDRQCDPRLPTGGGQRGSV